MDLIGDHQRGVATWVQTKCGGGFSLPEKAYQTLALIDKGEIVAGTIWFGYTGTDIFLSLAIENGTNIPRRIVHDAFYYPFVQLNCNRVSAEVLSSNRKCLKILKILGFQREGLKREAGPDGEDVEIWGLLKSDFARKGFTYESAISAQSPGRQSHGRGRSGGQCGYGHCPNGAQ